MVDASTEAAVSFARPIIRSNRTIDYAAGDAQVLFYWLAPLFDAQDLDVSVSIAGGPFVKKTLGVDYTISIAANSDSASVTFAAAPKPGSGSAAATVRFVGRRLHERQADVTRSGTLISSQVEKELDKQTVVLQELRRDATAVETDVASISGRTSSLEETALRVPDGEVVARLPAASMRAGKALAFDGSGQPLAVSPGLTSDPLSVANMDRARIVADVQASSYAASVTHVETLGYYEPGDGGGAIYRSVATQPSHPGKLQSADGRWWELTSWFPNSKMFGAIGSFSAPVDDSARLQAMTDFAVAKQTGFAYVMPGLYDMASATWLISSTSNLVVSGSSATLRRSIDVDAPVLKFLNSSDVYAEGLSFSYTAATSTSSITEHCALQFRNCTRYGAENCSALGKFYVGVFARNGSNGSFSECHVVGFRNRGIYLLGDVSLIGVDIQSCTVDGTAGGGINAFNGNGNYGIQINAFGTGSVESVTIEGCTVQLCAHHGISVGDRAYGVKIIGNNLRYIFNGGPTGNQAGYGVFVEKANGYSAQRVVVSGNFCTWCYYGIYAYGVSDVTIEGNAVVVTQGTSGVGIYLNDVLFTKVLGNQVELTSGDGILVYASGAGLSQDIDVSHNIVRNCAAYGINTTATCDGLIVANNRAAANTMANYSVLGTNVVNDNNR